MEREKNPGDAFERRVASHVNWNYGGTSLFNRARPELSVYRRVPILRTVTGRSRIVDLLLVEYPGNGRMMALECWHQDVKGSKDREYAHRIEDARLLTSMGLPTFVVYAGEGFSEDVVQTLRASRYAVYCDPEVQTEASNTSRTSKTWELDQAIAVTFGAPGMLIEGRTSFRALEPGEQDEQPEAEQAAS